MDPFAELALANEKIKQELEKAASRPAVQAIPGRPLNELVSPTESLAKQQGKLAEHLTRSRQQREVFLAHLQKILKKPEPPPSDADAFLISFKKAHGLTPAQGKALVKSLLAQETPSKRNQELSQEGSIWRDWGDDV